MNTLILLALAFAAVTPYGAFDVLPAEETIPYNVQYAVVSDDLGPDLVESHATEYPGKTWDNYQVGDWLFYNGEMYSASEIVMFWYTDTTNPYAGELKNANNELVSWSSASDMIRAHDGVVLHTCLMYGDLAIGFRLIFFTKGV